MPIGRLHGSEVAERLGKNQRFWFHCCSTNIVGRISVRHVICVAFEVRLVGHLLKIVKPSRMECYTATKFDFPETSQLFAPASPSPADMSICASVMLNTQASPDAHDHHVCYLHESC